MGYIMSKQIEELVKKIISKEVSFDKAMSSYDSLSFADQTSLLDLLRNDFLKDSPELPAKAQNNSSAYRMRTVVEQELEHEHTEFINELTQKYIKFVPKSRDNAIRKHRHLVDPRKVANLRKTIKSLQFHMTYESASGAYLYDIDGNKYIDITGDNGVNILGHQHPKINESIMRRIDSGYPLVGYTEDLFEVAELFCRITGNERVLFTQSGTEAVMWAVKIARAYTNREKIVIFDKSFHGFSDTVGAVRGHHGQSFAAGLGIPQKFVEQIIILNYGEMEGLEKIRVEAKNIACVLVEPVQAAQPKNQPKEFLQALRELTSSNDILLVFDEMITGLRVCSRGAQSYFGVQADIATYGKVPGGGMPTGMIAGRSQYMDVADGGVWDLDDESMPSLRRIFVGGTHSRNPIKLAAAKGVLSEIARRNTGHEHGADCNCFQKEIALHADKIARELNSYFVERKLPVEIQHFSSLFRYHFIEDPGGVTRELFFVLLRMNGVETSVSGNCFLNDAHSSENIDGIVNASKSAFETLISRKFFKPEIILETDYFGRDVDRKDLLISQGLDVRQGIDVIAKPSLRALVSSDLEKFISSVN
jgi:glutamate-1-semialdehyde 2,1-aminomutase